MASSFDILQKQIDNLANKNKNNNNSKSNNFNFGPSLLSGQHNQLGFNTQATGKSNFNNNNNNQIGFTSALAKQQQTAQQNAKKAAKEKEEEFKKNSHEMNWLENAFSKAYNFGENISDLAGFSESWEGTKEAFKEGNIGKGIASVPGTLFKGILNIPGGMVGSAFTAPAKLNEATSGKRITEAKDGRISNNPLTSEEKLAQGINVGVDLAGLGVGGSGRLISGGLELGKTVFKDTAGVAVKQAAGRSIEQTAKQVAKTARQEARAAKQVAKGKTAGSNLVGGAERNKVSSWIDAANDKLTNRQANASFGRGLAYDMSEEGGEEFVQSLAESVRGNEEEGTGGFKELAKGSTWTNALEQGGIGAVIGGAMSGLGHAANYMTDVINQEDQARENRANGIGRTSSNDASAATPITAKERQLQGNEENVSVWATEQFKKEASERASKAAKAKGSTSGTVIGDRGMTTKDVNFSVDSVINLFADPKNTEEQTVDGRQRRSATDEFLNGAHLDDNSINILRNNNVDPAIIQRAENLRTQLDTARGDRDAVNKANLTNELNQWVNDLGSLEHIDGISKFQTLVGKEPGVNNTGYIFNVTGFSEEPIVKVNPMVMSIFGADYDGDLSSLIFNNEEVGNAARSNRYFSYSAKNHSNVQGENYTIEYDKYGGMGYDANNRSAYVNIGTWNTNIRKVIKNFLSLNTRLSNDFIKSFTQLFLDITSGELKQANTYHKDLADFVARLHELKDYNNQMGAYFECLADLVLENPIGGRRGQVNQVDDLITELILNIATITEQERSVFDRYIDRIANNQTDTGVLGSTKEIKTGKTAPLKYGEKRDQSKVGIASNDDTLIGRFISSIKDNAIFRGDQKDIYQTKGEPGFYEFGEDVSKRAQSTMEMFVRECLGKFTEGEQVKEASYSFALELARELTIKRRGDRPIETQEDFNDFLDMFINCVNATFNEMNRAIEKCNTSGKIVNKITLIEKVSDSLEGKLKNSRVQAVVYAAYKNTPLKEMFALDTNAYIGNLTLDNVFDTLSIVDGQVHTNANLYTSDLEFVIDFIKDAYKEHVNQVTKTYNEDLNVVVERLGKDIYKKAVEAQQRYQNNPNIENRTILESRLRDFKAVLDRLSEVVDIDVLMHFNIWDAFTTTLDSDPILEMLFSGNTEEFKSALSAMYITYNMRDVRGVYDLLRDSVRNGEGELVIANNALLLMNQIQQVQSISPFYATLCADLGYRIDYGIRAYLDGDITAEEMISRVQESFDVYNQICSNQLTMSEKKELIERTLYDGQKIDTLLEQTYKTKKNALTQAAFNTRVTQGKRELSLPSQDIQSMQTQFNECLDMYGDDTANLFEDLQVVTQENYLADNMELMNAFLYEKIQDVRKESAEKGQEILSGALAAQQMYAALDSTMPSLQERLSSRLFAGEVTLDEFVNNKNLLTHVALNENAEFVLKTNEGVPCTVTFYSFWSEVTGRNITSKREINIQDFRTLCERFPCAVEKFFPLKTELGMTPTGLSVSVVREQTGLQTKLNGLRDKTTSNLNKQKKDKAIKNIKAVLNTRSDFHIVSVLMAAQKLGTDDISKWPWNKFKKEVEAAQTKLINSIVTVIKAKLNGRPINTDTWQDIENDVFEVIDNTIASKTNLELSVIKNSEINSFAQELGVQRELVKNNFKISTQKNVAEIYSDVTIVQNLFAIDKELAQELSRSVVKEAKEGTPTVDQLKDAMAQMFEGINPYIEIAAMQYSLDINNAQQFSSDYITNYISSIVGTPQRAAQGFIDRVNDQRRQDGEPDLTQDQCDHIREAAQQDFNLLFLQRYQEMFEGYLDNNYMQTYRIAGINEDLHIGDFFGSHIADAVDYCMRNGQTSIDSNTARMYFEDILDNMRQQHGEEDTYYQILSRAYTHDDLFNRFEDVINITLRTDLSIIAGFNNAMNIAVETFCNDISYYSTKYLADANNIVINQDYANSSNEIKTSLHRITHDLISLCCEDSTNDRFNIADSFRRVGDEKLEGKTDQQLADSFKNNFNADLLNKKTEQLRKRITADMGNFDVGISVGLNGREEYAISPLSFLSDLQNMPQTERVDYSCSASQNVQTITCQDLLDLHSGEAFPRERYRKLDQNGNLVYITPEYLQANRSQTIQYTDDHECTCHGCCATHGVNYGEIAQSLQGFSQEDMNLKIKKVFQQIVDLTKEVPGRERTIQPPEWQIPNGANIVDYVQNVLPQWQEQVRDEVKSSLGQSTVYRSFDIKDEPLLNWVKCMTNYLVVTYDNPNGTGTSQVIATYDDIVSGAIFDPQSAKWAKFGITTNNFKSFRVNPVSPKQLSYKIFYSLQRYANVHHNGVIEDIEPNMARHIAYEAATNWTDARIDDGHNLEQALSRMQHYEKERRFTYTYRKVDNPQRLMKHISEGKFVDEYVNFDDFSKAKTNPLRVVEEKPDFRNDKGDGKRQHELYFRYIEDCSHRLTDDGSERIFSPDSNFQTTIGAVITNEKTAQNFDETYRTSQTNADIGEVRDVVKTKFMHTSINSVEQVPENSTILLLNASPQDQYSAWKKVLVTSRKNKERDLGSITLTVAEDSKIIEDLQDAGLWQYFLSSATQSKIAVGNSVKTFYTINPIIIDQLSLREAFYSPNSDMGISKVEDGEYEESAFTVMFGVDPLIQNTLNIPGDSILVQTKAVQQKIHINKPVDYTFDVNKLYLSETTGIPDIPDPTNIELITPEQARVNQDLRNDIMSSVERYGADIIRNYHGGEQEFAVDNKNILKAVDNYIMFGHSGDTNRDVDSAACLGIVRLQYRQDHFGDIYVPIMMPYTTVNEFNLINDLSINKNNKIEVKGVVDATLADAGHLAKSIIPFAASKGMIHTGEQVFINNGVGNDFDNTIGYADVTNAKNSNLAQDVSPMMIALYGENATFRNRLATSNDTTPEQLGLLCTARLQQMECYNPFAVDNVWQSIEQQCAGDQTRLQEYQNELNYLDNTMTNKEDDALYDSDYLQWSLYKDIVDGRLELSQDRDINISIRTMFRACERAGVNPFYLMCTATRDNIKNGNMEHHRFKFNTTISEVYKQVDVGTIMDFFSFSTATADKPSGRCVPASRLEEFRQQMRDTGTACPQHFDDWQAMYNEAGNDDWFLVYPDTSGYSVQYGTDGKIKDVFTGHYYISSNTYSHDQAEVTASREGSIGSQRNVSNGLLYGASRCNTKALLAAMNNYYSMPRNQEAPKIKSKENVRELYTQAVESLPNTAILGNLMASRILQVSQSVNSLFEPIKVYSETESDVLETNKPNFWEKEVAQWNSKLKDVMNDGQRLNSRDISSIVRRLLGITSDKEGNDNFVISYKDYERVKKMFFDHMHESNVRNENFLRLMDEHGSLLTDTDTHRYSMAYCERDFAHRLCQIFNENYQNDRLGTVGEFLEQGLEHAKTTIENINNLPINSVEQGKRILMNHFFDAMQLANGENPRNIYIGDCRLSEICRTDYTLFRRQCAGFTQDQFEVMREWAQEQREAMRAMQERAYNIDVKEYNVDDHSPRGRTIAQRMMESKNETGNILRSAVKIEQAMVMANPSVAMSSFLDKGVSSTTMLYALRAADADGLKGKLSPYTKNGIQLNDGLVKSMSHDRRVTETLDSLRLAVFHGELKEMLAACNSDPTMTPKKFADERYGKDAKWFEKGMNIVCRFGSAADTFKKTRNEVFLRRLADYLGEEGLGSVFGAPVDGVDGMNMLEYMLSGGDIQNPAIGIMNLFDPESGTSIQAERAFNACLKGDMAQDNLATVIYDHVTANKAWLQFLQATFGCTFFRATINLGFRKLQHILPMSAIQYMVTREIMNRTTDEGLRAQLAATQISANLREALLLDSAHIATPIIIGILLSFSGGIEPPDDEDKWGNVNEWLIFGHRIQENWWIQDLLGVWLPLGCMYKAAELGKPNSSLLFNGLRESMTNNPLLQIGSVLESITDPNTAIEEMNSELEKYVNYKGGEPGALEYLAGNLGAVSLNTLGKFITPGFIKELGRNMREYEVAYNKIYTENVTGGLTTEAQDDGQVEYTTFSDAMIRKVTRNNPMLGLIMDIIPNGAQTGYLASEMPKVKYMDQKQYSTMHNLSVMNEDGSQKSDEEIATLCSQIISVLADTEDLDGLYKQGFCLDSETKYAVSQMLYDLRQQAQEQYNQTTIATNGLDYYVLGDGDYNKGKVEATKYKDAFYDYKNQIQETYNKLWSDELNQGIIYYNRYNTTYNKDANGNYYATGFRKGLGGVLSPVQVAPGTIDNPEGTTGYENDWGTPSMLDGSAMYDENGNAMRALVGYEDRTYDDNTPSLDDFGNQNNSNSSSQQSYAWQSGSGSSGYSSGGYRSGGGYSSGGGGSSYTPKVYHYTPQFDNLYVRSGFSRRNIYGPDIDQLRPQYETKGSREAYRRQDF